MNSFAGSDAPGAGLRDRVLTASLRARAAGRATPEPPPIPPVEGLRRSVDAMDALLSSLSEGQWHAPALRGLDVQSLIGHLIGVEDDVRRAVTGDAAPADADHVASTQPSADRQHGRTEAATRQDWLAATRRTLDLLTAADPDRVIAVHGLRLPVQSLCVVRTFEVWTHENDIRRAVGLSRSDPDASTLTLMTRLATAVLPLAVAAMQFSAPVGLRLVLTGPGGGTWQIPLGDALAPPTHVGIVTDAVGFCRLVANRLAAPELNTYLTGDAVIASKILHAATTLALD